MDLSIPYMCWHFNAPKGPWFLLLPSAGMIQFSPTLVAWFDSLTVGWGDECTHLHTCVLAFQCLKRYLELFVISTCLLVKSPTAKCMAVLYFNVQNGPESICRSQSI